MPWREITIEPTMQAQVAQRFAAAQPIPLDIRRESAAKVERNCEITVVDHMFHAHKVQNGLGRQDAELSVFAVHQIRKNDLLYWKDICPYAANSQREDFYIGLQTVFQFPSGFSYADSYFPYNYRTQFGEIASKATQHEVRIGDFSPEHLGEEVALKLPDGALRVFGYDFDSHDIPGYILKR